MKPSDSGKSRLAGMGSAYRIALIYASLSIAWIFGSDLLLKIIIPENIDRLTYFQTIKGVFFVTSTAGLIFFLIRDALGSIRKSQSALQESEERFRRMVDWSPNGVFIQFEGRFTYVNHALVRLLVANEPGQLIGRPVLDFIHPDYHAVVKQRISDMREHRIASPLIEERMRRTDGSYIWVEVTAIPLDVQGQPSTQVIVRDIHARKQAENELRQLNETLEQRVTARTSELMMANEDLRTFSYMLSHDLRTPLQNTIRLAEDLLQTETGRTDQTCADHARRIVASAARLDRLIHDLYDYNQLARADIRLRRVSLILVVHELIGALKREPEFADAQIGIREPLPWILAHRPTLSLVLQNLLHNAVTFVAPGVMPIITIRAEAHGSMARIFVEDNGIGIESTRVNSVFNLLEQPRENGEAGGIGLAVVRRGVERMGGTVGVESISGAGSKFWFELPLDPQSP